jgi:hypothetical protein
MTPNGKLDRAALSTSAPAADTARGFPRSDVERAIAAIWKDILGIDDPGLDDNFFELGGHSLLLLRVQARLQESVANVSIIDLFRYPSIRTLARSLMQGEKPTGKDFTAVRQRARKQEDRLRALNKRGDL